MTPQEVKLWCQLKHYNARGFHFRRQAPIGNCIVDFAEKTSKLVIEVDGSQHGSDHEMENDRKRDAFLLSQGYRVLRFWNVDVDTAMDGVIDKLNSVLLQPPPGLLRKPPSPLRGEG